MVFPIVGGDGKPTGYEIDNSMRFNDGNANRFQRTPSSAGSRRTFTYSCWIKLSDIGNRSALLAVSGNDNNTVFELIIHQNGYLMLGLYTFNVFETNMLFRDPSAWYHIVLRIDSTEGSSDNRVKLYVNGNRLDVNGISRANNKNSISQNFDFGVGVSGTAMAMGSTASGGDPIGGYMSEINFVDGAALGPDKFGETNDDGVWVPIEPDVSAYGTNGFFLEFKGTGFDVNSDGVGADTSGNDNHHGSTNFATDHITTDTPTNNFATMNPLAPINGGAPSTLPTFSEGNTQITVGDGTARFATGTFATSMPYYFEVKVSAISGQDANNRLGIVGLASIHSTTDYNAYYYSNGEIGGFGEDDNTGNDTITANDIIGVAVDLAGDNSVKFYENGDLQGTVSVGSAYQGLSTTPFARLVSATTTFQFNFGNPLYANSSSQSDANGYGDFEYAVPSGYFALCTKNLAEYG